MLVREWLTQLGVNPAAIALLEEQYPTQRILQQLQWLRYRNPRDPAAMLVSAVQGDWDPPLLLSGEGHPGLNHIDRIPEERALSRTLEEALEQDDPLADVPGLAGAFEDKDAFILEGTTVDVRAAWSQLLAEVRLQMTRVTFDTWLGGTEVAGVHGKVVSVLVRDGYAAEWLQARWNLPIERTLSGIVGQPLSVRFLGPDALR